MINAKFKDSPLGPIPQDWEVKRLGEISQINRGGSPRPIDRWLTTSSDGVNWIKIGDVDVTAKYICKTEEKILPEAVRFSREVKPGDFLLSNSMSFGRPYIMKIFGCIHDGWLTIQNYNETFDCEYLYYILGSESVFQQYVALADGSSVKNLNKAKVSNVLAVCPPLPEQRRIAEALGEMDRLIELLDVQIVKKRRIAQGLAHDLLGMKNEECGMRNEPIRRLPGFKGKWVKKRLGDIGKFYGGLSGTTASDFGKGNAHYITFLNVLNNTIIDETEVGVVDIRNGEKQNQVKKGDLFFNVSSETVEEVAMCSALLTDMPDTYLNSFCCGFRLTDAENDPLFISYFFNGEQGRETVKGFANGITRYNMSKKAFYDAVVCWPSLAEQRAIAEALSEMDAAIAALETKREKYKKIKAGTMRDLLSGKKRLKGG